MKIARMHDSVREAVLERNPALTPESDVEPEWALAEWSAWEIGDSYWAWFLIARLDEMRGDAS